MVLRTVVRRKAKKVRRVSKLEVSSSWNVLQLLADVLKGLDATFLRRRQTYHVVAASATLPACSSDKVSAHQLLVQLMTKIASRSPLGGQLEIGMTETTLDSVRGVELCIIAKDEKLRQIQRADFIRELYAEGKSHDASGSLATLRQDVVSRGGRLWCEVKKGETVEYHLFLAAKGQHESARQSSGQETYRYDIVISQFARLRKAYGIQKATALVTRVEDVVRELVRHPVDVVIANRDQGTMTVLYEMVPGSAESVAGRISRRLATEPFSIGRKPVALSFRYQLTVVPEKQRPQES